MRFHGALLAALALAACAGGGGGSSSKKDAGLDAAATDGSSGPDSAGADGAHGYGDIGSPCASNADCTVVPGSECFLTIGGGPVPSITFPGGFCSKACDASSSELQCGARGSCASTQLSDGKTSVTLTICTVTCAKDDECRQADGYQCNQLLPGIGVCAP